MLRYCVTQIVYCFLIYQLANELIGQPAHKKKSLCKDFLSALVYACLPIKKKSLHEHKVDKIMISS